jgi:FkbM family methyltransferase
VSNVLTKRLVKFCRLRLGLKPIIDYAQSRSNLIGVGDLPIRTVFDVGANVGRKSRHFRRLFPDAKIYCFEPVPVSYQRLDRWARRQHGKVEVFNLALGNESGETTIHWNVKHSGGSSLIASRFGPKDELVRLPVRIERLDTIAADLELQDDIFVKIDVEGFDMEVIRGASDLIRRAAAVMVEIRLYESPCDRPDFAQFVNAMTEFGYMYRGNVACGYVQGIPRNVDAVFIKPPHTRRAAA